MGREASIQNDQSGINLREGCSFAAAEFWDALNCGVTQAHKGGISASISALAMMRRAPG
jgi:hypothetical protein